MPRGAPLPREIERGETLRYECWNVVVWNDPVSLMDYVVLVFRRLFGYDQETATRLMLQVHNDGRAVVATQPREQAEVTVSHLHAHGLQATLARG